MSKEPTNSEFIEGARALIRQGANDAQWEFATLLRKACDRLDKATQQPSTEFTKRFRISLDSQDKTVVVQDAYEACKIIDRTTQQRKDLIAAAEEGLHECERTKMHCTCKYKNIASLLLRIERIEATIAKAEKEG